MATLGDFLEVVYGVGEPFKTVRASVQHWRNRGVGEEASERARRIGRRKKLVASGTPREESKLTIWMALPNRVRIEEECLNSDQGQYSITIVNGDQWWTRDREGHVATSREGRKPPLIDAERHFDHAQIREFFVFLALEAMGATCVAGRDCLRIRAIPRPDSRIWPHWLPHGAEDYEFHADPTRGALLSVFARVGGRAFEAWEITDVTFDESIDDTLFRYTPADGEQVRPAEPTVEQISLEAAICRMTFRVILPTRLPEQLPGGFQVLHHPSSVRSPRARLCIMYQGGPSLWLDEAASPNPGMDALEWEPVLRGQRQMRISDPGAAGMRVLALESDGTYVTLYSDLDRERLLDVADSLAPASVAASAGH